ncbi:hypothetical protein ACH4FX_12165 [Streptomyces sp. NPDC018019]|uniref:hypothetical protein n=1 Tax=Streptomyces sp. NPDC018019 TaxID=3365030 RepID=UPI00379C6CC4
MSARAALLKALAVRGPWRPDGPDLVAAFEAEKDAGTRHGIAAQVRGAKVCDPADETEKHVNAVLASLADENERGQG